jgi:hypothetical protein
VAWISVYFAYECIRAKAWKISSLNWRELSGICEWDLRLLVWEHRTPVNAKPEQAMAPYYTSVRAEDISATPCMSCVGWSRCCSVAYSRWRGSPSEIAYEEGWGLDDCSKGENKNNEINKLGYWRNFRKSRKELIVKWESMDRNEKYCYCNCADYLP